MDNSARALVGLAVALLVLVPACRSSPLTEEIDGGGQLADLIGAPPSCIGLRECDCLARADCQPITESCWCPDCFDGKGDCVCGGGRYFGCAPRASQCKSPLDCSLVGRAVGPDGNGCLRCELARSCSEGKALISSACGFGEGGLGGLGCDRGPDCILKCMSQLRTCSDVGCSFCLTCDCAGTTPFAQCYGQCVQ